MSTSAQQQITVFYCPDGWWRIHAEGRRWGRFQYRVDAEEAALRLAAKACSRGREAQVLVQQRYGELLPLKIA